MDHLGSYIFHDDNAPSLDQHLVLGWSLGGHAAWQVIFNEPRVTAAVVVIGCPDYMSEYARQVILGCFDDTMKRFPQVLLWKYELNYGRSDERSSTSL